MLAVQDLTISFRRRREAAVTVVDHVSLTLHRGRAHAIVGESGSGKSVSMRAVLGLLPDTATVEGRVLLDTGDRRVDLASLGEGALQRIRGRHVGLVFQNAMDAMNPILTLERQLCEPLLWHGICSRDEARRRAVRALGDVGIPEPERRVRMYPFQLSGGMRQRAMIAMSMIANPDVLIADEPTTAVDVTVQRQILDLLSGLKEHGTAIVMITHDLGVARYFCDDISVMYAGQVVESGTARDLLDRPLHPYTQGLLASAPEIEDLSPLHTIPGQPPDMAALPVGCRFGPRCPLFGTPRCLDMQQLQAVGERDVRCWKAAGDD